MDWYLNVLRNYIGFGGRARRKEYWMFVLVNFILATVLSIVDKILGWERAGEKAFSPRFMACLLCCRLGGSVPTPARHRSFSLVALAAVDPDRGLDCDPGLQLSERHAG